MQKITIFTDGASKGNPGNGGWAAVCVYPNAKGEMYVDELGGGKAGVTNNQMELQAAIEAFKNFEGYYDVDTVREIEYTIHCDSSYVINGITKWVFGWQQNGWMTKTKDPVSNADQWKELARLVAGKKVAWKYVGGHRGIIGNERCDEIATSFADGVNKVTKDLPTLYKGSLASYSLDILNIDISEQKSEQRDKTKDRSKQKAFSYVSAVNGEVQIHQTWAECEARVKGKSGVKYKKSLSKEDEIEIVKEFSKI